MPVLRYDDALKNGLETRMGSARHLTSAGRFGCGVLAILAVWFAALTAVPVIRDEPGQYLVIGPTERRLEAIRTTPALLVSAGPLYTHIATSSPGLVARLYAGGAWLVLPASNGGCIRLGDWKKTFGA